MTRVRSSTTVSGLLALVLAAGVLNGSLPDAVADPRPTSPGGSGGSSGSGNAVPTQSEVDAARQRAAQAGTAVERVQARLDEVAALADAADERAARAAEAYNGAAYAVTTSRRAEQVAKAAAAKAAADLRRQEDDFRGVVVATGAQAVDLGPVGAALDAEGMETLLDRISADQVVHDLLAARQRAWTTASARAEQTRRAATAATAKAEQALDAAAAARDRAQRAAAEATAARAGLERRRSTLIASMARLQGTSVALARQRQQGLAAQRVAAREAAARRASAREAAARQAAARRSQDAQKSERDQKDQKKDQPTRHDTPAPAPGRGAQAAIAFARAQLGEPYVWGADGPGSWDCSGLTSAAWAAGGKSLPHYSVAQYDASTPIDAADLRPGDLVFWGDSSSPSSIFHVALYVGGGRIIHAPRTGRPVTEDSLYYWRTPDFYARP